jgi:hypothetical protein
MRDVYVRVARARIELDEISAAVWRLQTAKDVEGLADGRYRTYTILVPSREACV